MISTSGVLGQLPAKGAGSLRGSLSMFKPSSHWVRMRPTAQKMPINPSSGGRGRSPPSSCPRQFMAFRVINSLATCHVRTLVQGVYRRTTFLLPAAVSASCGQPHKTSKVSSGWPALVSLAPGWKRQIKARQKLAATRFTIGKPCWNHRACRRKFGIPPPAASIPNHRYSRYVC